ncbi:MAG: hypothetical protein KAQ63_03300 [Candidatus Moranbacteria bacterium]|nr:hypothetical protein [Candidatus Moranbacteria bacterium]
MNLIESLEAMNEFLNQSYVFRAFKFFLAFYLIVIVLAITGIIIRIWQDYTKSLFFGAGYRPSLGKYQKRWNKLNDQIASGDLDQCNIAVLECSQMLNEVLKAIGYDGDNLGERLKSLFPSQLDSIEKLKVINEVKNKIVQNPSFKVTAEEAAGIRDIVGKILDSFEVINLDKNKKK